MFLCFFFFLFRGQKHSFGWLCSFASTDFDERFRWGILISSLSLHMTRPTSSLKPPQSLLQHPGCWTPWWSPCSDPDLSLYHFSGHILAELLLNWAVLGLVVPGNGTPLPYSCLENPMDRGAWWAAVHGVAKSWTQLSDFTFTSHFYALEKEVATHSSVLAWRIPGTGEPRGLPAMGLHRVGYDWSHLAVGLVEAIGLGGHENESHLL